MTSEFLGLHAYAAALVRRERSLLRGQALLRALLLLAVCWGAVWLAARLGVEPARAVALLVVGAGVGAWAVVALPMLRSWSAAGDAMRQARLVEGLATGLQGRLITVVERPDGGRPGESEAVLGLVARRATEVIGRYPPEIVHPAVRLRRLARWTAAVWLLVVLLPLWFPAGPRGVAGWWLGDASAVAAVSDSASGAAGAPARVGDISLRYIYPPYTGLEPYEVANSSGEVHAPPGTRVEVVARSAVSIEGAALVAYGGQPLEARVVEGRQIEASFVVQATEGEYHLVTHADGQTRVTPSFPIVPEPDLAPVVTLSGVSEVIEVAVDEMLAFDWAVKDDFGVERVVLELDGQEVPPDLRRLGARKAEVTGELARRPLDLGMKEGSTYDLTIAAWDNDTVSGSKVGRSVVVRVVVLGEDGVSRMTPERRKELRALLVAALADHLEEPFPPGVTEADFARWGEVAARRYQPIAEFLEAFRSRRRGLISDLMSTEVALEAAMRMIRHTQVSFVPGRRTLANDGSVLAVVELRDVALVSLEDATLDIDRLISLAAYREVAEASEQLATEGRDLAEVLDREVPDAVSLAVAFGDLASMFDQLTTAANDLREGGMKSFVASRAEELSRLNDAARESVAADELDRARGLGLRLSQRLDELARGIQEQIEDQQEQAGKQKSAAQKLIEELEQIRDAQNALAAELDDAAAGGSQARAAGLSTAWKRVREHATELRGALGAFDMGLEANDRSFNEREFLRWTAEAIDDVVEAAAMQDLLGATLGAGEADGSWRRYALRFELLMAQSPAQLGRGPGARQIQEVRDDIDALNELVEVLRRLDAAPDPALRAAAVAQQGAERALWERTVEAEKDARRVAQELPVTPRGLSEAMADAVSRMSEAAGDLARARAEQAEGSERYASRRIEDAIRAIRQAMSASSRQSNELESGGGEGDEPSQKPEGEAGEKEPEPTSFRLPEPEEFQTPEQYRKALLEGMEGQVPEEYRAMKRRYYEELVQQ
jgi:hypothetical protein